MRRDDLGPKREPSRPVLRWTTPTGRTEEYAMSNERPATIGRDPNCTIPLDSRMVSKAHALVEFRDGEYTIQDLESANGTRVNGEATSVRVLEPGDNIEVGDIALQFLDLGSAGDGAGTAGAAGGGSKAVRLALTATITLVVMVGLLYTLLGGPGTPVSRPVVEEALAPAPPELLARLRAAAAASPVVKEVVQYANQAGAAPAKALLEEGRLRLESQRWHDAAVLLAAAVASAPKMRRRILTVPPRRRWPRRKLPITACAMTMPRCMRTRYCSWSIVRTLDMTERRRSPSMRAR